jgi:hypothetical protein
MSDPIPPSLPRLSEAELATLFGEDVAALRRYRMLVALLREERPVGEVARAFGVSRESIRRLRRAYGTGDLAALRTRRRGGGHFAKGSPLARALREELGKDPSAPAAELLQRIEAVLAAQGRVVPRSTFYRLLARLRDDEADGSESDARSADRLLRDALGALIEDPPLTLGRGTLAELLLAEERDLRQRGYRMAAALRAAIARIAPTAPDIERDDPRWRHHAILSGEYLEGRERADLEAELALSASTYSRAKREAIERLRALLPAVLASQSHPSGMDLVLLRETARSLAEQIPPAAMLDASQRADIMAALAPLLAQIEQIR